MHYWNQRNFEGLAAIGAALAAEADLALFSQYCLLREQGLKKPANAAASAFAAGLGQLPVERQRELAVHLLQLQQANPQVHQLLAYPVRMALQAILRAWCDAEPQAVLPRVNLGLLIEDISWFKAALQLDPHEQTARYRLAVFHLNHVDFQTHHLSESRLIGSQAEARESLQQAAICIEYLADPQQRSALLGELAYFTQLIDAWSAYCAQAPAQSFTDWSQAQGQTFSFPTSVYYTK